MQVELVFYFVRRQWRVGALPVLLSMLSVDGAAVENYGVRRFVFPNLIPPGSCLRVLWSIALGVSLLIHAGLLIVLACWHFELLGENGLGEVNSAWVGEELSSNSELTEISLGALMDKEDDQESAASAAVAPVWNRTSGAIVSLPRIDEVFSETAEDVSIVNGMLNELRGLHGASETLGSHLGVGEGGADGGDRGPSFFGLRGEGQRYVYVVDSSRSMNHPHDSEMKTRFRRLKLELVKSIMQLNSSNDFYIVFFNQRAISMPSRKMEPAFPDVRKHFLEWAIKIRAEGDTDPRGALKVALKLNPDVIYFLTDGAFEPKIVKFLQKISQEQTVIHTFAFGNRQSEHALRMLASANGGKFHFVP